MNWTELLKAELEPAYKAAGLLMDRIDEGTLGWKPATGVNWMTTGQLLKHLTNGCGMGFRGFATGDWGMPKDVDPSKLPPDAMLPPAEKMPAVSSVAEAKRLLAEDRQLALDVLAQCGEERLAHETATAPWDPRPLILGHRLLQMVDHVKIHKAQLFYYLKLQGKPVNTHDLWGM